jgi:hypothetical protein
MFMKCGHQTEGMCKKAEGSRVEIYEMYGRMQFIRLEEMEMF